LSRQVLKPLNDLLVVGSVAIDNVETPFGKAPNVLGGAASYFSLAASLFTPVRLVAVVGKDFPAEYLRWFEERDIDLAGLQRDEDGSTFRWTGDYGYDLNVARTIDTQLNVFASFKPQLPQAYRDSRYVYLANILPSVQGDVLAQIKAPQFVGLDSMNFWIENPETRALLAAVIDKVDAVFMNDAELRQYTGDYNLVAGARKVLAQGPRVVLIKKGEHGVLAVGRDGVFAASAFPLDSPMDPTGAGDTFAGGFMGHIAQTGDTSWGGIKRAAAYGCVVASFTVEDFSVNRLRSLTMQEIRARYAALADITALEAQIADEMYTPAE
jgi:sugar/nucleoside kinase (ribokinase family)